MYGNYVLSQKVSHFRNFCKLRISNHQLAIEKLRYSRPKPPRELRFCNNCNDKVIGDEQHFLLHCSMFDHQRKILFDKLSEISCITNLGNDLIFKSLMTYNDGDCEISALICKFVDTCFSDRTRKI